MRSSFSNGDTDAREPSGPDAGRESQTGAIWAVSHPAARSSRPEVFRALIKLKSGTVGICSNTGRRAMRGDTKMPGEGPDFRARVSSRVPPSARLRLGSVG